MRLAFVTTGDARDVRFMSGAPYYLAQALCRRGVQLEFIGPLKTRFGRSLRAWGKLEHSLGRGYLFDRNPLVLRSYADQVARALARLHVDAVFSPGTIPVACLETELPVITWTDATFANMVDYHPAFTNLSPTTLRQGHEMERQALRRVDAALYSSEWAARSAVADYGADPRKVHTVPFGANLTEAPTQEEAAAFAEVRSRSECELLYVGVDWARKGGDLVLELAERLRASGVPVRLTVVGCNVPPGTDTSLVDHLGFIDKSTREGEARIGSLLRESHFLCLPSRAECYGIVYCEASAYGVPSLGVQTGGVGSAVSHGANGYLFHPDRFVGEATAIIARCLNAYDDVYFPLALSARKEFDDRLNWTVATQKLVERIEECIHERS